LTKVKDTNMITTLQQNL